MTDPMTAAKEPKNRCAAERMRGGDFLRRFLRVSAAGAAVLLAGCSWFEDSWLGEQMKNDDYVPPCPKVRLQAHHDTLTLFTEGLGRDLIDVRFEADLKGYVIACEYDIDDETQAGTLYVQINAAMNIDRGPADKARRLDIPYFVVLRDGPGGEILQKNSFSTEVEFEGNQRRINLLDEPVNLTIPLYPGRTGRDFTIYMGFQLTEEHVKFNRAKKGGN